MSGEAFDLLVSVWGDPGGYRRARYVAEDPGHESVESRSPTAPLLKWLRPRRALVLASSTLAVKRIPRPSDRALGGYADVERMAEEYLREVLEREEWCPSEYRDVVEARILPGVGSFKDGGVALTARGSPTIYGFAALVAILEALERVAEERGGRGELRAAFDLSHGLNYMTFMAARAFERAAVSSVVSGAFSGALLRFYNSDPPPSESATVYLRLVEETRIGEVEALRRAYSEVEQVGRDLKQDLKPRVLKAELGDRASEFGRRSSKAFQELDKRLRLSECVMAAGRLAVSARRGLPLVGLHVLAEMKGCPEAPTALRELLELLLRETDVDPSPLGSEGTLRVLFPLSPNPAWHSELLYALSLAARGGLAGFERLTVERLREEGATCDGLRLFRERFISDEAARVIVDNELHDIKLRVALYVAYLEALGEAPPGSPVPYAAIYELGESAIDGERAIELLRERVELLRGRARERTEDLLEVARGLARVMPKDLLERAVGARARGIDERNFFAHAGLERNAVLVLFPDPSRPTEFRLTYADWEKALSVALRQRSRGVRAGGGESCGRAS